MTDAENYSSLSLFDRIGGEFTLNMAIEIFYEKIAKEEELNVFFEDVSLERKVRKQRAFMRMVMGKTNFFEGKSLRSAHDHLPERGFNEKHLNTFVGHFADTLRELGIEESLIKEVLALAESYRDEVLNR